MASIHKYTTAAGKTLYSVAYRKPTGTQSTKRGFATKRDAAAWAALTETNKRLGAFIDEAHLREPMGELIESWLAGKVGIAPLYRAALVSTITNHVMPRWGLVPIGGVKHSDVQKWVAGLSGTYSPTIVLRAHGVLNGVLQTAVLDQRLRTNPAARVQLPKKVEKDHVVLSHADVAEVAAHADTLTWHGGTIVYLLAYCGLRFGELAALRVESVNPHRRRLTITRAIKYVGSTRAPGPTKGKENRETPYPQILDHRLRLLTTHRAPHEYLLTDPRDATQPLPRPHWDTGWFNRAVNAAGIPRVTPHDLRHTTAAFAISAGANVKVVQSMLGHKSAALTLDTYGYLFDDDLDAVATALNGLIDPAAGRFSA